MNTTIDDSRKQTSVHRSTRWLLSVIAVGLTLTATTRIFGSLGVLPADMIPASILHLSLILGLILMMGNIIVTEAWLYMAERTGIKDVMRFAGKAVNWADVFFTAPGIYLVVISGLMLISQRADHPRWLLGAEVSFILAGVTWIFILVPMQNRLAIRATDSHLDARFYTIVHRWYWLGILATTLTLIAVIFVIFQPT